MSQAQFEQARRNMVDSQILPNRVTDEGVIDALSVLPREMFVPASRASLAYADESLLIEDGRYLMQPMVVARLLNILALQKTDVALTVGCATGYAVALLSKLVDTVVAVESDASMRQKAERNFAELQIDNVAVVDGAMSEGYAQEAPYDVILIDGGVADIPVNISQQLSDGGRLAAVVMADHGSIGRGVLYTKIGSSISKRDVFDASEPLLMEFEREAEFSF